MAKPSMNTVELARRLAATEAGEKVGLSEQSALLFLEDLARLLVGALTEGRSVHWHRVGNFEVIKVPARPGRNPATGAPLTIAAQRRGHWVPSTFVKAALAEGELPSVGPSKSRLATLAALDADAVGGEGGRGRIGVAKVTPSTPIVQAPPVEAVAVAPVVVVPVVVAPVAVAPVAQVVPVAVAQAAPAATVPVITAPAPVAPAPVAVAPAPVAPAPVAQAAPVVAAAAPVIPASVPASAPGALKRVGGWRPQRKDSVVPVLPPPPVRMAIPPTSADSVDEI